MIEFKLPDIGEGLQEAEIVRWHVKPGDSIKVDEVLLEVETDKAVVEIPSPITGTVAKLFGQPGDTIKVGSPLVGFEGETAAAEKTGAGNRAIKADTAGTDTGNQSIREDAGTVVGRIESSTRVLDESPTGVSSRTAAGKKVKAPPAVRSFAAEKGVDLSRVRPTGPGGSLTRSDIESYLTAAQEAETTRQPASDPPSESEPLRRARRSMALNMASSHEQVAQVTVVDDADITHWPNREDLMVRLVHAIADACGREPALNAFYDHTSLSVRRLDTVHLGIAVDTPDGLYVPVIKNAEKRTSSAIRSMIDSFKTRALEKSFKPDDLRGGSIILSNLGSIGGRYSTPMVVPPMVSIVGVGRSRQELALVVNKPVVRLKLPLSLSFDHRAVTGGEAGRFLRAIIESLES